MKKIFIVFTLILFLGCAAAPRPTASQLANADYGPYPSNYEQIIKDIISPILIDPYSAVLNLNAPKQGYNNMVDGIIYGWNVCGTVNAKNRFGGYVGPKPIYAMIKNGAVVRLIFGKFTLPDSPKLGIIGALMETSKSADTFCE